MATSFSINGHTVFNQWTHRFQSSAFHLSRRVAPFPGFLLIGMFFLIPIRRYLAFSSLVEQNH
jgi:hypothetical protein